MDKSADGITKKNHQLSVKQERIDEDIKEFAETAMNELLGWYGYGNNNREQPKDGSYKSHSNTNSSGPDSPKYTEGCGWCGKPVDESCGLSSGTAVFCTELCFSQSRRANFKKNKTCDWCRHVRHTVSYVDFQDGASQLQFCSDKCLNQYKMHIFCRETRAHLEMHPHLAQDDSSSGLITPDLWMKNCKSPDSRSPSPKHLDEPQTSPLPLITVAHPSKLLASPPNLKLARSKPTKRLRKRLPSTVTNFNKISEIPQDLRVRHSPKPVDVSPEKSPDHYPNQFPPQPILPPDHRFMPPPLFNFPLPPMRNNILPPVTVMVPYPVMIPVPIPIPIPLPLSSFLKAAELKNKHEPSQNGPTNVPQDNQSSQNNDDEKEETEIIVDDDKDQPASPVPARSLRKKKRVVEPKSKIVIKSKKSLSV